MTTTIEWAWSCMACTEHGAGRRSDSEASKHTDATGHSTTTHLLRDNGLGQYRADDPITRARRDERDRIVAQIRSFEKRGIPLAGVIADHVAEGADL